MKLSFYFLSERNLQIYVRTNYFLPNKKIIFFSKTIYNYVRTYTRMFVSINKNKTYQYSLSLTRFKLTYVGFNIYIVFSNRSANFETILNKDFYLRTCKYVRYVFENRRQAWLLPMMGRGGKHPIFETAHLNQI